MNERGDRNEKMAEVIKRASAQYFERESNRDALVSVTNVVLSDDGNRANIFISVLPDAKEMAVLNFAKRNLTELREYIKKNVRSRAVPHLEVHIDLGEKNRQRLDNILR